jgi:uncharacterized membrane protein (UPF0127 family)
VRFFDAQGRVLRECTEVELATSPEARQQGLGGRQALSKNQVLVLRYPVVDEACITNSPVAFPIAAVFADADGGVVAVERFEAREAKARCNRGVLDVFEVEATLGEVGRVELISR